MTQSFKRSLESKDRVVTVELPLAPNATATSVCDDARRAGRSVDGFLVTDNLYGQPHMSPVSAASILLRNELAPVLQISARNRNRIALIGELLGARANGIDSLFLVRGGVLPEGYEPRPKAVMDTDAKDLIATAKLINDDERFADRFEFLIGTSATAHDPEPHAQPEELAAKADAGARLVFTQICMDVELLGRYFAWLVANGLTRRLSVMVSVTIPSSADAVNWLRRNRRGTIIPDRIVEDLNSAADADSAALDICAGTMRAIVRIPGVAGINFAAIGDPGLVPEVLDRAGVGS